MSTPALHQVRDRWRSRGQSGVTMLEVVLMIALTGLLTLTVAAWTMTNLALHAKTRTENAQTATLSLTNAQLLRDVSAAKFAWTTKTPTDPAKSLADCAGGGDGEGDPILALVMPGNERIVYTLGPKDPGRLDRGQVLYRRSCANAVGSRVFHQSAAAGFDATYDRTTTDTAFLDVSPAPSTPQVEVERVDDGFESVATECAGGSGTFNRCQTILLDLKLQDAGTSNSFQVTRRTDSYCPPGCPPIASFSYEPSDPQKNDVVKFDGQASSDPRDDYITADTDLEHRLIYTWNFDVDGCGGAVPVTVDEGGLTNSNPLSQPWVKYTKPSAACPGGTYKVSLVVTNAHPTSSAPPLERDVLVTGLAPIAQITSPSPSPVRVVRNSPIQFAGIIQTLETNLDPANSYWDFGDGTPRVPLTAAAGSNGVPACPNPTDAPLCTAVEDQPTHTFLAQGTNTVRLVVTDLYGLRSVSAVTIIVESEYLYVSETHGDDYPASGWCGTISPVFRPCKTVAQALSNAKDYGRTDIIVGFGTYPSFTVQPGIDVSGGHDDTGGQSATWAYDSASRTVVTGTQTVGPDNRVSITAVGGTAATTIAGLTLRPGNSTAQDIPVEGVLVDNSINLTLRDLIVENGDGRNPTGVLARNNSAINVVNSTIESGTPTPPSIRPTSATGPPTASVRSAVRASRSTTQL